MVSARTTLRSMWVYAAQMNYNIVAQWFSYPDLVRLEIYLDDSEVEDGDGPFGAVFASRVFHITSVNAKEAFLSRAALRILGFIEL
jgi:hypothetical protein